jgi:flagellar FliL protein
MSDEPETEAAPAEPAPTPPRRGGALKLVLLVALPLTILGAGGAWWMLGGSSAAAAAEEARLEERGIVPLETFLVNLSDPGGNRFLKLSLQLVFATEADAKHVEGSAAVMGHVRSAILELLTEQNAQALVTASGKQQLKESLKTRLATILTKQKVLDVLFSEFVVQF